MNGYVPGTMRAGDATHSQPTIQGRVVQNAKLDVYTLQDWMDVPVDKDSVVRPFGANMETANLGSVAGEISYRLKAKRTNNNDIVVRPNPKRTKIDSTLVPVFSALNGMVLPMDVKTWNDLTESQREAYIWSFIRVAGIIGTTREYDDMKNVNGREDLANLLGGVWAVINDNSQRKTIYGGNLVCAAIPRAALAPIDNVGTRSKLVRERIQGIEKNKILLETVPYDASNIITQDSLKEMLDDENLDPTGKSKTKFWPKLTRGEDAADIYVKENFVEDLLILMFMAVGVNGDWTGAETGKALDAFLFNQKEIDIAARKKIMKALKSAIFPSDDFIKDMSKDYPAIAHRVKHIGHKVLNGAARVKRNYDEKVIGIALSDAPPGVQFDIKEAPYTL